MIRSQKDCNKILQERQVIQANTSRIEDLSRDLMNLSSLQETAQDMTTFQSSLVNEKRINLRNNIVNLKEGLQIHYILAEETLQPLISDLLMKALIISHMEILRHLSNLETMILNLSPLGMLFNSNFLKEKISAIFLNLQNLNCQESSLLAYSGISSNEEP